MAVPNRPVNLNVRYPANQTVFACVGLVTLLALAVVSVQIEIALLCLAAVFIAAFRRPQWAAYLYSFLTPLVVGINRGSLLPGIRLNEALLGVLLTALAARAVMQSLGRGVMTNPFSYGTPSRIDVAVVLLVAAGSLLPLLFAFLRDRTLTSDDLSYALAVPKFGGVYLLFRMSVSSLAVMRRVLMTSVSAAAIVAVVGILQAAGFPFVQVLLAPYAADSTHLLGLHATSTVGSSLSFADVMNISCAIVVVHVLASKTRRLASLCLGLLFAIGALASGEASGIIGLVLVLGTVAVCLGEYRRVFVGSATAVVVALPLLVPVLSKRLDALDPATGLPTQWTGEGGRWDNLRLFVWPRIAEGTNWLFGVQLSAEVPSTYAWRSFVYIESGYTWAVWTGGVFLLLACLYFIGSGLLSSLRVLQAAKRVACPDFSPLPLGVASLATFVELGVLMVLDPHITMRGGADITFALAAMISTALPILRGSLGSSSQSKIETTRFSPPAVPEKQS